MKRRRIIENGIEKKKERELNKKMEKGGNLFAGFSTFLTQLLVFLWQGYCILLKERISYEVELVFLDRFIHKQIILGGVRNVC